MHSAARPSRSNPCSSAPATASAAPWKAPPTMTDEPEIPFEGLDAERPLPPELRARLEAALLGAVPDALPVPAYADSLDAPRPLPEPLRVRLESALLAEAAAPSAAPATE